MRSMALLFVALAFGSPGGASPTQQCRFTPAERAWVEHALSAADRVMEQRLRLPSYRHPTVIVFNQRCRFERKEGGTRWSGEPHSGKIRAGKANLDAGLTAFQDDDRETGERLFVMALPSIWEAAHAATPGDPGLTAVFLHEFSHARQSPALAHLFERARTQFRQEPDNDDSLQERFKADPAFVAVWEKETALLYEAAAEPDDAKARRLAKQALDLMEARQRRWFVGADSIWKPYDDLYLTMEGFAQWTAYAWLSDPAGPGMTRDAAREKMRGRRRQWSQEEGLGLYLVIDRFVPDWAQRSFARQPALGIDLLRLAAAPAA